MASAEKLGYLLDGTKRIIAHQKEVEELRGEAFNVFSILKMERLENGTHSAFLTELLNPDGSHRKGNIFLKLFLETLQEVPITLDLDKATVKSEHHVGTRDVESRTGGRIDIYITDNTNCISIENKIDAGDQEAQIERYCNHKKGKNTVLYLTLQGTEPSNGSKGALESGVDFYTISYRQHIIEWLDKCLKEATDTPILRETIKQYKILIQKLTSTMAEKQTQELKTLMLKHFDEAEYIAANFERVKIGIKEDLRQRVIQKLRDRIDTQFTIAPGDPAHKVNSQIWIKPKGFDDKTMFFGVESFSGFGLMGGVLFVGLVNVGDKSREASFPDRFDHWWFKTSFISGLDEPQIRPSNSDLLKKLYLKENYSENLANHIVVEVEAFIRKEEEPLREFLEAESLARNAESIATAN